MRSSRKVSLSGVARCFQINHSSVLITLELQLTILKLVKSLQEADFEMYVMGLTCVQLMPWVFALDQPHQLFPLVVHTHPWHVQLNCGMCATHLWVVFGVGNNLGKLRLTIYPKAVAQINNAFPWCHALTNYDTTSFFPGKRKNCLWDTWNVHLNLTVVLVSLSSQLPSVSDEAMAITEQFVLVYDWTSNLTSMNSARQCLYCWHTGMIFLQQLLSWSNMCHAVCIKQGVCGHKLVQETTLYDLSALGWEMTF